MILGSTAGALLTEGALRRVPGLMPRQAAMRAQLVRGLGSSRTLPDSYIGFRLPPHYHGTMRNYDAVFRFSTDAHGFRNPEPWPRRADIIALGDSLTFGFGARDGHSWVDTMARTLGNAATVNLSLPGLGPFQYLRLYASYAVSLRPKIVLVGFFPANDFWDTDKFLEWLNLGVGENYLLWRDFGVIHRGARGAIRRFLRTSYLYQVLSLARHPHAAKYGRDVIPYDTREGRLLLLPSALQKAGAEATPGRPGFDEAFRALEELDRRVRADGGHMIVVVLPSKEYVYLPLAGVRAPDDPFKHVWGALDGLHLRYLDATPHFRERAAAGERLFFKVDGHPNERGYDLIAETIVDYLRTHESAALANVSR